MGVITKYFIWKVLDWKVLNIHGISHFGEIGGDYRDHRNENIYYLLEITPSVVIITDWLKMDVSYIRVGI